MWLEQPNSIVIQQIGVHLVSNQMVSTPSLEWSPNSFISSWNVCLSALHFIPFGKFSKLPLLWLWLKSDWLKVILWLHKSEARKQSVAFSFAFECFNTNRKVNFYCLCIIKRFNFLKKFKAHFLKSALAKALQNEI